MSTAQDQLDRIDQLLDEYENSIGLPSYSVSNDEVNKYLQMKRNVLEKLSPQDCAEIAYILSSYAFYLQKMYNREVARISWGKSTMRDVLAGQTQQYHTKFSSYEERKAQAVKGDGFASNLDKIMVYAQTRADRLTFLSNGIRNMVEVLSSLQKAKAGSKYHG